MAFFHGILFGLTLSVMIGPIFFTIIQTSIDKGFGKAFLVAVGVSMGDIIMILLTYVGLSKLIGFNENKELISYIGALILAVFGIVSIVKANRKVVPEKEYVEGEGFFRFIIKGFLINAINPFIPIFWIGAMSIATVKYGYQEQTLFAFFATIICIVFATDLLKAYLATKLSRWINDRIIKILNITVGVVLILFALRMATYFW
jgi:threonine/homoserine/homoserine lactone efflux protein